MSSDSTDEERKTPSDQQVLASSKMSAESSWDGPDDPGNPRNWSILERTFGVAVPAWYAFAVTFGTSVYASGVFDIMAKFQVSRTVALLGVSLYALGIGLGPVFGAPISETLGRRWVYLLTMPPFLLFTMGAGLGKNIGTVLVCRFLASILGAPAVAVGAGSVADLWDMQQGGGIAGMLFVLMPFLGSSLGPLIGGFAVQKQGEKPNDWAWTMWVIIIIAGPAWIASFFARESYAKVILAKRAIARGLPQPPKPAPKEALRFLLVVTLLRPVHMLLLEPIVGWMSLYVAFAFGILFATFDAFPYVFGNIYHFELDQIGLTYLGIIVGILIATLTFGIVDKTIYAKAKSRVTEPGKIPPPEERLYLGTSCYLVDAYQAINTASAIAANSLLRYIMAAAFPLFTVQMYDRLGVNWAASLLGFVAIAMLPIPWILYYWGPFLRRRSAYEMGNF
ncbi:MAG: hypothetical protein Q9159_001898 [Coniocarpon cinnabarinum]